MNWNKWIRLIHRWLSLAFTAGVLVNTVAVLRGKFANSMGLMAAVPLILLLATGLYLFVLPYASRLRSARITV
ncbi:MAG: hypothetical protein WCF30_18090 [Terracidiphilus sp.]